MTDEDFQKLQQRVAWGKQRLDLMNHLVAHLRGLETDYADIFWNKKSTLSGQKLFEASCHLQREIEPVEEWLNNQTLYLNLEERNRGQFPTVPPPVS